MSLPQLSVIVAIDSNHGFAKNGKIPWNLPEDRAFFKQRTIGNNVIIMGKDTYLALPEKFRPLPQRKNVVISSTLKPDDHPEIKIYKNLTDALIAISKWPDVDKVYIGGGQRLYQEVMSSYLYLCEKIYVSQIKEDYACDRFFPAKGLIGLKSKIKFRYEKFDIIVYYPNSVHQETKYLDLIAEVKSKGDFGNDRTGVGTYSLFGKHLEFDIRETVPALTTKKLLSHMVVKELLWMVSGSTNSKVLEEQGVNIWKGNSSREFLDRRGLSAYVEGDIGPGYGFQYRHWGANYEGCSADYKGQGIDQLSNVINEIKTNPTSRRLIVSAWNVADLPLISLPPCHLLYQFNVSGSWLDCQVYQRSADLFLGLPFNLLFYSILTYMVAHLTGLKPRKLSFCLGNAHIYANHLEAVDKLLQRTPFPWATLEFKDPDQITALDQFNFDNIVIKDYVSWSYIGAPMAV